MKWITALDLQQWMEQIPSRTTFPAMVGDLIRASVNDINSFRFPSGDKGQVRGFDGHLDALGAPPYVPDGLSIWEFGLEGASSTKADSDYQKRTGEVSVKDRKQTTLVIVSPRTWDTPKVKIQDWVAEKKALNEWKDVVYFDGSMLESWLEQCPAVAARYARNELNVMPLVGARSTDEYWDEFSLQFNPTLAEQVLLAGREMQAAELVQKMYDGGGLLRYAADSPEEVVAFAVAAIRLAESPVRLFLEARTIIVDSKEAARQLSVKKGLAFLPTSQAKESAGLLSLSGPTVASAGAEDKHSAYEVLRRPTSQELGAALKFMGMTESEGYDLARKCGRSLAVLGRLRPNGNKPKPEWLVDGEALLPALLAGAWSSINIGDQDALCALGKKEEYAQVEAPLRKLTKLQDPPIDHVGDVWSMRASVDAFVQLGHLIGQEHLDQFKIAADIVFSKVQEPPNADDIFGASARRSESHSHWLKNGMMNTLLHMAVLHEQSDFTISGTTPQDFVNRVIRDLPGLSSNHELLASLEEQLSLLAEAAPIPFLEALERLLEGDAKSIRPIFDEQTGFIAPRSYHCGVLWGLEVVAWDPQLLYRASICLARLAAIDPGGRVVNRPINSLRSIFLAWAPNTAAKADVRRSVLSKVVREVPDISWSLIEKLLPTWSDVGEPNQKPLFREYLDGPKEVLTYGLIWACQANVVELALSIAGKDVDRWTVLIRRLSNFPKQSFELTINELDTMFRSIDDDARFKIWDELRKEVNRHVVYSNADWAFPPEIRSRLEGLLSTYAPKNSIDLSVWLFDEWLPDIPERASENVDISTAVAHARTNALKEVFSSQGINGVLELASRVKLQQHVALSIRALGLPLDNLFKLFELSLTYSSNLDMLSAVILNEGEAQFGDRWLTSAKDVVLKTVTDRVRIARLLMSLTETNRTWKYVSTFGDDVNAAYWKTKQPYFIQGDLDELMLAVSAYLRSGRPLAAISAVNNRLAELPTATLFQLLDEAINEINAIGQTSSANFEYSIEVVFDELQKRSGIDPSDIATREFEYLPIFRHSNRGLVLHRLMIEQPQFFVDAMSMAFRPEGSELPPPTIAEQRRASSAYALIDGLAVLPGQSGTEIDVDKLMAWCVEVRRLALGLNLAKVVDNRIGQLIAHAPPSGIDHAWPHESVRIAIERLASDNIDRGVAIERFNMRGAYSKAMGEGGAQERELAEQSKNWAESMPAFPRVAAILLKISDNWLREAKQEDINAEQEILRW